MTENTSKYPPGYEPPPGFVIDPKTGLLGTKNYQPKPVYTKNEPLLPDIVIECWEFEGGVAYCEVRK